MADVYRGTHMQGVKRGSVKALRVVESPEKRHWSPGAWFGQGYTAPGMNWHSLENKRILGTVPVEEDGSAYFTVPAETFVYFQLLDADGMMIQSMRSGASVQSGERAACVGCHDQRRGAPPASASPVPLALRRKPSALGGWHGPPREFSFMAEVQPVFTKHCAECHDLWQGAGQEAEPRPRPHADLQHRLHGTLAQGIHPLSRRRPRRDPGGLLLGLASQQARPGTPPAAGA